MAENIKKRSATHIYYGVDSVTGDLKHISEVSSGLACGCKCAACGGRFEARKGTQRRHHFAHESNYECMYASEVAIYRAVADILEKLGQITLPPAELRFPTWARSELIQDKKQISLDAVSYECGQLAYPPSLLVTSKGGQIRILLDFSNYYDEQDYQRLAAEAKEAGYACLSYAVPDISKEEFFDPESLKSLLLNGSDAKWVFNRSVEQWREKYQSAAYAPETVGGKYLCPLHKGCLNGQFVVSPEECSYCSFNVGECRSCLCLGKVGYESKQDFYADPKDMERKLTSIRSRNDARLELARRQEFDMQVRLERQRSQQAAQRGPSQNDLDAEYERIVMNFDEASKEPLFDKYDRRWVKCSICGQIKESSEMTCVGFGGVNIGECRQCARKGYDAK